MAETTRQTQTPLTAGSAVELLRKLPEIYGRDIEGLHAEADDILLRLIDRADVSQAFAVLERWYA